MPPRRCACDPAPGTREGLRNHALLAVLLGSCLRISEVLQLDHDQYTSKGFARVQVKGGRLRDFVPVQRDPLAVLEQWLEQRGNTPGPLFPTRSHRRLSRREAAQIMQRIAGQANATRPAKEHIQVSPHVLRHTFLRELMEGKGSIMPARLPATRAIATSGVTSNRTAKHSLTRLTSLSKHADILTT